MLVTNPKVSRLAAVGRFYVPLSQAQQSELITAMSTIENLDALPSWMSDYFSQVEQMFEQDKAGELIEKHGDHDQKRHGRRASIESPEFTENEFEAISSYSGSATVQVNHHLRGFSRTRGIQPAQGVWQLSEKKINGIVKELDSAIDKSTLPQKLTLQREIKADSLRSGLFGSVKGKTISDKGFLSLRKGTSEVPPLRGYVKMRITAPAGTKALDLSFINPNAMGEVIFPRNTQIKVTNIIGKGEDTTVIGEIVG